MRSPQIHEYDSRSKACIDVPEVDSFLNIEHSGSELHTECEFRYQYDTPGIGVTFYHVYAAVRKALRCGVSLSRTRITPHQAPAVENFLRSVYRNPWSPCEV